MKAIDVARHFLFLARSFDAGDTISNLKMQKMLYYAQGWHFAYFGKELFDDEIEAWKHGPVIKTIYDKFKKYGSNSISFDELEEYNTKPDEKTAEFLYFIFKKLSAYPAWELADKTHYEPPYLDNYSKAVTNIIPKEQIKAFFIEEFKKEIKSYSNELC